MTASRPGKLSHSQTMLYEIDLFRYAALRLAEDRWQYEMEKWVLLEVFLLHFRNLIEFFGSPNRRQDDLSILRPELFWPEPGTPADDILGKMHRQDLWEKYEARKDGEKISRYLQHCTEQRIEPKNWEIGKMFQEIAGVLDSFESYCPTKPAPGRCPTFKSRTSFVGLCRSVQIRLQRFKTWERNFESVLYIQPFAFLIQSQIASAVE